VGVEIEWPPHPPLSLQGEGDHRVIFYAVFDKGKTSKDRIIACPEPLVGRNFTLPNRPS